MADCGNWQGFTPADSSWDGWTECQEVPPTVIPPGIDDRVNTVGEVGGFDVSQHFNEGAGPDPVYTATGLPSGASISETGFITYDLTTAVTTDVTVTLTTGQNPAASDTFNWIVNAETLVDGWATETDGDWLTETGGRWILE